MVTDGDDAVRLFELRTAPTRDLAGQADAVAAACHAMAVRVHSGGKLVVFGTGAARLTRNTWPWSSSIR